MREGEASPYLVVIWSNDVIDRVADGVDRRPNWQQRYHAPASSPAESQVATGVPLYDVT